MKNFKQFINESTDENLSEEIELFRQLSHIDELEIRFYLIGHRDSIDVFYFYNKKLLFIYDKENGFFDMAKEIFYNFKADEKNEQTLMDVVKNIFNCYLIDCSTINPDKKTDIEKYFFINDDVY